MPDSCLQIRRLSAIASIVVAVVLFGGCDVPPRPPLSPVDLQPPRAPQPVAGASDVDPAPPSEPSETVEPPGPAPEQAWESWDACYLGNQPIGYSHVRCQPISDHPRSDIRYEMENRLLVRQGQTRLLQRMTHNSVETYTGKLVDFESALYVGPSVTRFQGSMRDDQLVIETIRNGQSSSRQIAWDVSYRGPVAIEQSIRQRPLVETGQRRTLRMLLPGQHQIATVRLRCDGHAAVPMIDSTLRSLIEIACDIEIAGQPAGRSTIWTDDSGAILRTFTPSLGLVAYRTDQATATAGAGQMPLIALPARGEIDNSDQVQRLALKVTAVGTAAEGETAATPLIEPVADQYVRRSADGSYEVLISRSDETLGETGFEAANQPPVDGDRLPNRVVDSDAALLKRFADAALGARELTPRQQMLTLASTVQTLIASDGQTDQLQVASQVARDGVGGSTQQAILLAALLRSRNFPARLAIGLKYSDQGEPRWVYQMWTMAYLDGRWVHLDATSGGLAPADRLTLVTTNFSDDNETAVWTQLLQTANRIAIEIRAAKL